MNRVIAPINRGDRGQSVSNLQEILLAMLERDLIRVSADEQGALIELIRRERGQAAYDDGTARAVGILQDEHGIERSGNVDEATAEAINEIIDRLAPGRRAAYTITGRIVSEIAAATADLRVEVYRVDISGHSLLGTARSSSRGDFALSVDVALEAAGETPDLQARVFNGEAHVGSSQVAYNAPRRVELDVRIVASARGGLADEHSSVLAGIRTQFGGRPRDLDETKEHPQLTYLSGKTGWDARLLAMAAAADDLSAREPDIEAPLLYALFRAGLPTDEAVFSAYEDVVERIWDLSEENELIPRMGAENRERALRAFGRRTTDRFLASSLSADTSTNSAMLALSLGDDLDLMRRFTDIVHRHRNDPERLEAGVRELLDDGQQQRLKLNARLGFLTLNNAPLIEKLHGLDPVRPLEDSKDLVHAGFFRADRWLPLLADVPIPREAMYAVALDPREQYAEQLAGRLRIGYPTSLAMALYSDETILAGNGSNVVELLRQVEDDFVLGREPIEKFARQRNIEIAAGTLREIKRYERVYQITTRHEVMTAMLNDGIDSSLAVLRFGEADFVHRYQGPAGGAELAKMIHEKAKQVHNIAFNLTIDYVASKQAGAQELLAHYIQPGQSAPAPGAPEPTGDVIAYPTLEELLGEMDYCACEHCRSVLSPAAYLVDLLMFLDRDPAPWAAFTSKWKADHGNAPYPFLDTAQWDAFKDQWQAQHPGDPLPDTEITPFEVLRQRRPDIQHLALTCENTNVALPYIDLVNELLEHFVLHDSLASFEGHDTDPEMSSAELLANPVFVSEQAYVVLKGARFPGTLPLHQPLELLRRLVGRFDVTLDEVLWKLRRDDALASGPDFGLRDVYLEKLRLSRQEYGLLTDASIPLQDLYGFATSTPVVDVIAELGHVPALLRRLDVAYTELIELLKTHYVNPNAILLPKVERLGVSFAALADFKNGVLTAAQFDAAVSSEADPAEYGGDIKAWVLNEANYQAIMSLIVITDPTGTNPCSLEHLELRLTLPDMNLNALSALELVRIARFVRLWKKLGWSLADVDRAVTVLYPGQFDMSAGSEAANLQRLDAGFAELLPKLGALMRLTEGFRFRFKHDFAPLRACIGDIDTHGSDSLYARMFLKGPPSPSRLAFEPNGYGQYLTDSSQTLYAHAETLRAAFNITAEEFEEIGAALAYDALTPLTIETISAVYRRAWLARALRLSVRELIILAETIVDAFAPFELPVPPLARFVEWLEFVRGTPIKPGQLAYLLFDRDASGRSQPGMDEIASVARSLRDDLAAVEQRFEIAADPDGGIAKARMALVYDAETTDTFFGLIDGTFLTSVALAHTQPELSPATSAAADGRIVYDRFRKTLSFSGVMTIAVRDALKAAGEGTAFDDAIDALYAQNAESVAALFARYPELAPLYDEYVQSSAPLEDKRGALLEHFLPTLIDKHKRLQAVLSAAASLGTDDATIEALLVTRQPDGFGLHSASSGDEAAILDYLSCQTGGLSATVYDGATAAGPSTKLEHAGPLAFGTTYTLPANTSNPALPVSLLWRGRVSVPETGLYNFFIAAEPSANVELEIDGTAVPLTQQGAEWSNTEAIELDASSLHDLRLTVENVQAELSLSWETQGRGRELVPARFLYAERMLDELLSTHTAARKVLTFADELSLTPEALIYLAFRPKIDGASWLNQLRIGPPSASVREALLTAFRNLGDFVTLRSDWSVADRDVVEILEDPQAAFSDDSARGYKISTWLAKDTQTLLQRFGLDLGSLGIASLRRVRDAEELVKGIGVPATLLAGITNEPTSAYVDKFKQSARARYAESDWLDVVKPINDDMRRLQRDALVAYCLHRMQLNPASAHVDTPDKLFEFFLVDVQMDPCTLTSRIRLALSSCQLFIERCIMNLEPRVAPSTLKTAHWSWMKRYRVWEANRKVFLWPENWLLPELRDDQSSFFREALSGLLEGDITRERAEGAIAGYLGKLEEVAKLEPCAIFYVDNEAGHADDVVHVVARTPGAGRKYFYRRKELNSWTPWEPIKLDIEDKPIHPVVWRGRLFLFWLRVVQKDITPPPSTPPSNTKLQDVDASDLIASQPPLLEVRGILNWSEYYDGKWQPPRTSEPSAPGFMQNVLAPHYRRRDFFLTATETGRQLRLGIHHDDIGWTYFALDNVNTSPLSGQAVGEEYKPGRKLESDGQVLTAKYRSGSSEKVQDIVRAFTLHRATQPNHDLDDSVEAPFLYETADHVFYVNTERRLVPIKDSSGFMFAPELVNKWKFEALVAKATFDPDEGSSWHRAVSEDAYLNWAIDSSRPVKFKGGTIRAKGIVRGTS